MGATVRLFRVNSVSLALMKRQPPLLAVTVQGQAATPGYSNIRLNVIEGELSPDGIFDLELVGDAPGGMVPQVVTPVTASTVVEQDVERIVGVMVHARSNNVTELLGSDTGRMQVGADAFTAFGLDQLPIVPPPVFKTFAFGEEMWSRPRWFLEGKLPLILEGGVQRPTFPGPIDPGPLISGEDNPFAGVEMRNPFGTRSA
jgi:hypothetical protein